MARKSKSETPSSRVALLREERGWSQSELADKMYVTQRTISDIECDRRVTLTNVTQIADIFGVSVDYVLGRSNERNGSDEQYGDLTKRAIGLIERMTDSEKISLIKHIELENEIRKIS